MDQLSVKGDQVAVNGEQPALIFEIGELRELPEGCLFGFTGCTGEEALAEYRRLYGREAVAVYTRRGRFELGGRPWVQSWVRPGGGAGGVGGGGGAVGGEGGGAGWGDGGEVAR